MLRTSDTEQIGQLHDVQSFPGFRRNSTAPLMEVQPPLLILRCSNCAALPLHTYSNSYPTRACEMALSTVCTLGGRQTADSGQKEILACVFIRSAKGFFHLSLTHWRQYTEHNGPALV